jgi:hypothetical protein
VVGYKKVLSVNNGRNGFVKSAPAPRESAERRGRGLARQADGGGGQDEGGAGELARHQQGTPGRTGKRPFLQGTDVTIFLPKNSAKKLAFLTRNKAKLCKILIITLVFEKNANF